MKVGPKEQLMALDKSDPFSGLPRKPLFKRAERQSTRHQVDTKLAVTTVTPSPVTKRNYVTVTQSVTPDNSVTRKRGVKPKGEAPKTTAERMKAYRARKKTTG
jgi:hypothetical protein